MEGHFNLRRSPFNLSFGHKSGRSRRHKVRSFQIKMSSRKVHRKGAEKVENGCKWDAKMKANE